MKSIKKKIKYVSIILLLVITNIVHASQNKYIESSNEKELEIIEDYELGYTLSNIQVNKTETNESIKLSIKADVIPKNGYIHSLSESVTGNSNIKKQLNEEYNINEFYIIGSSEKINNLQSKWYRKITDSSNIGKGSVSKNNNIIINRNYGNSNDENIQNEQIYTSNKIINNITGYNLLQDIQIQNTNLSTTNNQYSLSFSFTIDKDKISEIRYIYVGNNENIYKQDNTIQYKSIISEPIDLYTDIDDIVEANTGIFSLPNEEASPSEIVLTENYKVVKSQETYQRAAGYYTQGPEIARRYDLNELTIKDSEQNPATLSEVKKFKLRQDNDNYYFDFDLVYENQQMEVTDASNIGNCMIYISNYHNDFLNYEYTTNVHGGSFCYSHGNYSSMYSGWYGRSGNNSSPATQYQSLQMFINGKNGTQTMYNVQSSASRDAIPVVSYTQNENINMNKPVYSSLTFPFEQYLGNGKTAMTSGYITYNSYDTCDGYSPYVPTAGHNNYCHDEIMASTTANILWTNGQTNKVMPIKPNYQMVNITSQNSDYNKDYWNRELIGTITINKADINNYKYINMYAPEGYIVEKNFTNIHEGTTTSTFNASQTPTNTVTISASSRNGYLFVCPAKSESAMSIHSTFGGNLLNINLTELSHCDHEWHLTYCDDTKHIMKCNKCEWEKDENHNYQYEYDGMTNNVCECSRVLHIKNHYQYNSDLVTDKIDEHEPNIDIATYSNPTKTGYIFKNYSVYHKIPNNYNATNTPLTEKYINTIYELPTRTATYSTIFKANYDPIKYRFRFKNDNNLNIILNSNLPDQEYDYDEEKAISDGIDVDKYYFKGWALATNSEVVINSKQLVKNWTATNSEIIELYPYYEPLRFIIHYKTNIGNYHNGTQELIKQYNIVLNDNISLDLPILNQQVVETKTGEHSYDITTTNYSFIEYQDENNNKFRTLNEIINYIKNNAQSNNITINLQANITQNTTKSYREAGGGTGGVTKEDLGLVEKQKENTELIPNIINNVVNEYKRSSNDNIKKNKDIIEYITEVYNDYINNNNIKNIEQEDIIDFIEKVYEDYINKLENNNTVIGFTNTLLSTNSVATKSDSKIIKSKNINEIKDNDYIDKIFETNKDKLYINNLLKDINKRDYYKIFDDFYVGKYKSLIDYILVKYNGVSKTLKKEFNKNEYKKFINNFKDELKDEKYQDLYKDLSIVIKDNEKQYKEINEYLAKFDYKKVLTNFNSGKYKDFTNDLFDVILNEKYTKEKEELENLLTEGKYNETFYDIIYTVLDVMYTYEKPEPIKTEIVATKNEIKPVIEVAESNIEIKSEANNSILPIILIICSILLIFIVIVLVMRYRNNKED